MSDLLKWKCACGWQGTKSGLNPTAGGGLVCPNCGGSGGLVSDGYLPGDNMTGKPFLTWEDKQRY